MSTLEADRPSPVELWLTQNNMEITCMAVREDERTEALDVDSLSMRGAQREMTGWLVSLGYTPVGRWGVQATDDADGPVETSRTFRRGDPAPAATGGGEDA